MISTCRESSATQHFKGMDECYSSVEVHLKGTELRKVSNPVESCQKKLPMCNIPKKSIQLYSL